jgi:hypothetical protein
VANTYYSVKKYTKKRKGENERVICIKKKKTPNEFLLQVESKSK